MKIIALEISVPGVTAEQFPPHLKAEALRVWELYLSGVLREIYYSPDQQRHMLVLECASLEEAHEHLNTLTLVKEGLIVFEVMSLAPYSGFARLFAAS